MIIPELFCLTIMDEDWGEETDDFWIEIEADIGIKGDSDSAEVFTIYVTSPKRLGNMVEKSGLEIARGLFIMKDFNIKKCRGSSQKNTCPLFKKNLERNSFSY
jgi:Immunity protein 8